MSDQFLQVSRDAAQRLTEFSDEMRGALALGDPDAWAPDFGLVRETDALSTVFPLPFDAAGYKEFKGDIKFRTLYTRSIRMRMKEWSDGIEEKAIVIEKDLIDWAGAPANMAREWLRLPQTLLADMLATSAFDGPLLDLYHDHDSETASTRRLFATDHPSNVLQDGVGTIDNTMSTTVAEIKDGTFFKAVTDRFRTFKGPNGKPFGLNMNQGRFLVPATRDTLFKETLTQDTLIRTVKNVAATENVAAVTQTNQWKALGYQAADELQSEDYFYAFASGKPGLYPFVIQRNGAPEERIWDKSSEKYKNTSRVGIAYVGNMNVGAAMPYGIIRVHITG